MDSSEARETLGFTRGFTRRGLTFDGLDLVSVAMGSQAFFERCTFAGADLRQATLDGAYCKLCSFRNANLRGASLRAVHFAGCDLRDADLRDADLTGSTLTRVNTGDDTFGRSDITGARLDGAVLVDVRSEDLRGESLF